MSCDTARGERPYRTRYENPDGIQGSKPRAVDSLLSYQIFAPQRRGDAERHAAG